MLRIRLFALARELAGQPLVEVPWSDGEPVRLLKQRLLEGFPQLQPLLPRLLIAVNNQYAGDDDVIGSQDDVACFPPVSGG